MPLCSLVRAALRRLEFAPKRRSEPFPPTTTTAAAATAVAYSVSWGFSNNLWNLSFPSYLGGWRLLLITADSSLYADLVRPCGEKRVVCARECSKLHILMYDGVRWSKYGVQVKFFPLVYSNWESSSIKKKPLTHCFVHIHYIIGHIDLINIPVINRRTLQPYCWDFRGWIPL